MKSFIIILIINIFILDVNSQENKFFYNETDYLTYLVYGNGSTNLIFLHGFGSSKNSWDDFYPLFDTSKYTLYLIDLKGFGNSSIPKDKKYSIGDHAEIISKFINTNVSNDYFLIGHSYGGTISLFLANFNALNRQPNGLILLDCAAYNIKTPFFINYLKTPCFNQFMYLITTPKSRAKYTLKRIVEKNNLSQRIIDRYTISYTGKRKKYSFIKSAKQMIPKNYEELIAAYNDIKIPTLIIWGKQDKVLSIEQGSLLTKQITNSKLFIIENCGHIPQEEKPIITFEIVIKFLKTYLE